MEVILPRRGESNPPPPGEKFFTVGIFRKNTSKYAELMVEPYICDSLNQVYHFFFIFNQKNVKGI